MKIALVKVEVSNEFNILKVSILTSFASDGNPNENVIGADMQGVQFEPVEALEPPFKGLILDEDIKFDVLPEGERLEIWDQLYKATNNPLY